MLESLALIFLTGMIFGKFFERIHLPSLIGMILAGILIGPSGLNLIDQSILEISTDLRKMALIIILIKAGLSLDLDDLRAVSRQAIFLSFLPASLEVCAYILLAPSFLGINKLDAALLGSVMAAVSPAVVVPRMVGLIDGRIGIDKSIPQMILAGASMDDVFVIVIFTSILGLFQGESIRLGSLLQIPLSIILGIGLGMVFGIILAKIFDTLTDRKEDPSSIKKALILTSLAFILVRIEVILKPYIPVSGLLAVMSMAGSLRSRSKASFVRDMGNIFAKIWQIGEILLFVLLGLAVDISYTFRGGFKPVVLIFLALVIRSFGTYLSLWGSSLNTKEKLFTLIAYLPKATV